MLPELSGVEVLKLLRAGGVTRSVPVVLLSARKDEIDRVLGFELGADDYVTKPFSPRELVARVKAVLRRAAPPEPKPQDMHRGRLAHGKLVLDLDRFEAHWDGTPETEEQIKELTKATIRCIPLNNPKEDGVCIRSGKPSTQRVLFARAY